MVVDEHLFHGLSFFDGVERLPGDLVMSLDEIRRWAIGAGLVSEPEFQLLTEERITEIARVCSPDDKLLVAIAIGGESGSLDYLEYPYLPVRSLIRRGHLVKMVYWKLIGPPEEPEGDSSPFSEVRFGFRIDGCGDEFCSMSTGRRVVPRFVETLNRLSERFPVKDYVDGPREITVDGEVRATFRQAGRSFDVELSYDWAR